MRKQNIKSILFAIVISIIIACGGGGGASTQSPVSSGPNVAPTNFSAIFNYTKIDLSWSTSIPPGIESLRVYRASYSSSGVIGTHTRIAEFPVTSPSYSDSLLQERIKYNYRLCYVKNNIEGPYATIDTFWIGLFPPSNFVINSGTHQTHLTWINKSSNATNIIINRKFSNGNQGNYWTQYKNLPATATSFVDQNILSGLYTYQLSVTDGSDVSSGPEVNAWALDSENPLNLSSEIIKTPVPGGRWWARSPLGNWVVLDEGGLISVPNGTNSWNQFNLQTPITGFAQPGIRLDSNGHPHLIYYTRTGSDAAPMIITHAWFDGSSWKTQEVARRSLLMVSGISIIGFDVTTSGVVHVFWQLGDGPLGNHIEYATNEGGPWKFSSVVSNVIDLNASSVFYVTINAAQDGTIYLCVPTIAQGIGCQVLVFSRRINQSWVEELAPLSPGQVVTTNSVLLLPISASAFDLLYYKNQPNNADTDLMCSSKRDGLWGQPELIASRRSSGFAPKIWGAVTKDGSRTAAGVCIPDPTSLYSNLTSSMLLYTRGIDKHWAKTTLTNSSKTELEVNYLLGFDTSNRLFALSINDLVLFAEH